jgi:hypothetical protein
MKLFCVLVEADPGKSLGGSCIRDLYNMANHLSTLSKEYSISKMIVITNSKVNKKLFPSICQFMIFNNYKQQFTEITNQITNEDTLLCHISGHGYQVKDISGDEIDGMDEMIKVNGGIILDDDIRKYFVDNIPKNMQFVGIADTCHSGSMFDLDYMYKNKKWIKDTRRKTYNKKAISIGACADNQLENCDIGNTIGFGGALTIHLIENNLVEKLINYNDKNISDIFVTLNKILLQLKQSVTIETCDDSLIL